MFHSDMRQRHVVLVLRMFYSDIQKRHGVLVLSRWGVRRRMRGATKDATHRQERDQED
jgi:hypothetical protein